MRLSTVSALAAAAFGGVLLLSSVPADAQTRRSQEDFFYYTNQQRDLRHKPRSRITVQRRSYLDPGPEQDLRFDQGRGQRVVLGVAGRGAGLPRPERRREIHDHENDHRLPDAEQRNGPRLRP